MRVEIDWETVRSVGLGVLLSIGAIALCYRAWEDDLLLRQVVAFLNQQAQGPKVAAPVTPNVQSAPPEKK